MSKNRKKKPNQLQQQKLAEAHHKKEYYAKLYKILDAVGYAHVLSQIPQRELERIFFIRSRAMTFTVAEGDYMPKAHLKTIRQMVSALLKLQQVQLGPEGGWVDLNTYLSAGITLMCCLGYLGEESFSKARELTKDMFRYWLHEPTVKNVFNGLGDITEHTSDILSDLNKRLYWSKHKMVVGDLYRPTGYHLVWHSVIPEKIHVNINGETHRAIRLGRCRFKVGAEWISIKAGQLQLSPPDKDIDVYIQAHALHRLIERNDCIYREMFLSEIVESFNQFHCQRDAVSGKLLIDFYLFSIKTGYFLADIIDNKLILRTFLFITHDGTPEGAKLKESTGLQKTDKQYLELDKLSTFMTPEIQCNEKIKKIFIDAGCNRLFDLHQILVDKQIPIKKKANTSLIEHYIGLDAANEFFTEDDKIENQIE
jgi:hypothetical protein